MVLQVITRRKRTLGRPRAGGSAGFGRRALRQVVPLETLKIGALPEWGQKIRERSIRFSLKMEAIHFPWPELRFHRFATSARTFADSDPGSCGIGNFSSGAGKCFSTIGCWRRLFLVQGHPDLPDKLRLKQSSVILSALAQKMLFMAEICMSVSS